MSGQDNMCGGANPLKSFQDQVGRDRSLHQDRAVNNGTPSTTFRSGFPQTTTNGDQEFANFQARMANLPNLPAMPAHYNGPVQGHSSTFGALAQRPQPAAAANVAAVNPNWAEEFRQLQANNEAPLAVANVGHGPVPVPGVMSAPSHGLISAPSPAMGFHMAPQFNPMFQQHMATVPAQAQATVPTTAPANETEHPLVTEAFTARFAQLEAQGTKHRLNDVNDVEAAVEHLQRHEGSFEGEMAQWFQEHGPTVQEQEAALEQHLMEGMTALADEQDMVEYEMNEAMQGMDHSDEDEDALAQDTTKTHVNEDLRRTAGEIVDRLRDSPRYQQSNFLTLMRNIMDGNVTVDEAQEGFVNTTDHQPYTGHLDDAATDKDNNGQQNKKDEEN